MVFNPTKGHKMNESQMTLAVDAIGQTSLVGWQASEKLNGCRAYWTGKEFWTRGGNVIHAPAWITRGLPQIHLDGEISCGRDGQTGMASFQVASNAVRLGGKWFDEVSPLTSTPLCFSIFDAPQVVGTWQQRMAEASRAVRKSACAVAVNVERIGDPLHLVKYMMQLRSIGAEGGMFRHPDAIGYTTGRTGNLLRWKFDNQN